MRTHLFISGFVQGVGFRSFVRRKAYKLGISGWVKNLLDGRVEAVFEGSQPSVQEMISFCQRGVPGSRVDRVDSKEEEPEGIRGFSIRYSGD